jgi:ribosomal-protein-alanine N-acetyltransferase
MLTLNSAAFPLLFTERLRLSEVSIVDAESVRNLRSDPNVNTFLYRQGSISMDEANNFIRKIQAGLNREWLYWKISLKGSNELIGTICIWNINADNSTGEIGYELFPEYQGKGLMQEAVSRVIQFAFRTVGFEVLTAFPKRDNHRSIQLLIRNNFKLDENLRYIDRNQSTALASYYIRKIDYNFKKDPVE